MSSSHRLAPSVDQGGIQPSLFEQWDRILLSSPISLGALDALPADLHYQASTYLHDRLSRSSPSDLPLVQLRCFLDHLYTSTHSTLTPELHPSSNTDSLQPEDSQNEPQLPHTPRNSHAHVNATQAGDGLSPESPRTKRVRESFHRLSHLDYWPTLVSAHSTLVRMLQVPEIFDSNIAMLARLLHLQRVPLTNVIAELTDALSDVESLKNDLRRIYQDPPFVLAGPNTSTSVDCKFAYLLVHLATSYQRVSRDVDVLNTNSLLSAQFGRQYRGDAQLRFLSFVTKLNQKDQPANKNPPYFRGTPIVQSSGTGKSRMIIELSKFTPLLYVCLRKREAEGNAKAGYPLPDQGVRKYFEDAHQTHTNLCDLQVACFLSAWFQNLVNYLRRFDSIPAKAEALLLLNRLDMENPQRREFFQEVSELATDQLLKTPTRYQAPPSIHLSKTSDEPSVMDRDLVFQHRLTQPLLVLIQELAPVSKHLQSTLPYQIASLVPPILVAFDECVEINVSNSPKGNTQLNSLLRAWHFIRQLENLSNTPQRLWLVLLSTSSSAAALIEHVSIQSSNRRRNLSAMPTFVGVGFDVLTEERPSLNCASDASQFQQVITYGRPLWSSLAPFDQEELWATARLKLLGSDEFDLGNSAQCFSILASRLALRLVPVHWGDSPFLGEQKAFLDQTVDRHMRILTHVTQHASMHVESPSEPVLAIAASLIMVPGAMQPIPGLGSSLASNWYGIILDNFRTRCLLSRHIPIFKGTEGELAARIVLTAAWDAAKERALQDAAKYEPELASTLSKPVLLSDIIRGLANLDSPNLSILQKRIQTVQAVVSRTDPTADVQAWTHFTHFDTLPRTFSEITPEYLWYCWKRGVALQMAHSQTGIDGILPVFIGDLNKPFGDGITPVACDVPYGARHMTFVAWEAKNRTEPQPSAQESRAKEQHVRNLAGPLLRRPAPTAAGGDHETAAPLTERALFCILADLGTNTAFQSTGGHKLQVEMIKYTDCPRLCIRGVADRHTYPCLDHFDIRVIFYHLLDDTDDSQPNVDDDDNTIPHPLWNNTYRPTLPAATAAAASASATAATSTCARASAADDTGETDDSTDGDEHSIKCD